MELKKYMKYMIYFIIIIVVVLIEIVVINLPTPIEMLSEEADELYGINNYTIQVYNCGIDSCVYKSIYPNFKINTIDFCGIMAIPNNDSYCKEFVKSDGFLI